MQQIIKTEDGSDTLYSDMAGQTYHSTHGAIQESRWIFIDRGLKYFVEQREHRPVSVLEIGFGTGLNALLAKQFADENDVAVEFSTIELYPLEKSVWSRLNYGAMTGGEEIFDRIHMAEWSGLPVVITKQFTIRKFRSEIVETVRRMTASQEWHGHFDVIMFDAFSPDAQPDLWQPEIFENLHLVTAPGGVLTTYCAKGAVRRAMQSAGFRVERLPGPPGKREILRGAK